MTNNYLKSIELSKKNREAPRSVLDKFEEENENARKMGIILKKINSPNPKISQSVL
jgi:hypothetical protein